MSTKNESEERCSPVCIKVKKDNVLKTEKAILEDCKNLSESLHEKIRSYPYWVLCMETIFYSKLGKEFIDPYLRGVSSSQKRLILPKSLRQVKVI